MTWNPNALARVRGALLTVAAILVFSTALAAHPMVAQAEVLATVTATDGAHVMLMRTAAAGPSGLSLFELRRNGLPLLVLSASRVAPWSVTVTSAAETSPALSVSIGVEGTRLVWSELRLGASRAVWRTSDAPAPAAASLLEMGLIEKDLAASPLAGPLALLDEVLRSDETAGDGVEALHLLDGLSQGSGPAHPDGKLSGYYNCLRDSCVNEAGGEWSEETSGAGGCHCDPGTRGLLYCVNSAIIYLVAAQRCWLDFMLPLPK